MRTDPDIGWVRAVRRQATIPTYDYRCENPTCGHLVEADASMKAFKDLHPSCPQCGDVCNYEFNPTVVNFVLKDGPSGSWPSKGNRFKAYRTEQDKKAQRRQEERFGHLKKGCLPNYKGERAESWREAQAMAMADKESHEARQTDSLAVAATFTDKIAEESQSGKKIISGSPGTSST